MLIQIGKHNKVYTSETWVYATIKVEIYSFREWLGPWACSMVTDV